MQWNIIKEKEILPFATIWMEIESIILSEISGSEKDDMWSHLYGESTNL